MTITQETANFIVNSSFQITTTFIFLSIFFFFFASKVLENKIRNIVSFLGNVLDANIDNEKKDDDNKKLKIITGIIIILQIFITGFLIFYFVHVKHFNIDIRKIVIINLIILALSGLAEYILIHLSRKYIHHYDNTKDIIDRIKVLCLFKKNS